MPKILALKVGVSMKFFVKSFIVRSVRLNTSAAQ